MPCPHVLTMMSTKYIPLLKGVTVTPTLTLGPATLSAVGVVKPLCSELQTWGVIMIRIEPRNLAFDAKIHPVA